MSDVHQRFVNTDVIRRVDREGALLLGGGRALLLQLAHPSVAAGVADHSDFAADPWKRLLGTLDAMYAIVFGNEAEADRAAEIVRTVHERVTGPTYRATDPALLCWVNATLVDTSLRVYRRLVGPLTPAEQETYYQQSTGVAEVLGCPRSEQPADLAAFRDYVRTMVGSLEVSDTAKELAASILRPGRLPGPLGRLGGLATEPPFALVRFVTVGMLPPPIRNQYGMRWDARSAGALAGASFAARAAYPLLPAPLRRVPLEWLRRRAA